MGTKYILANGRKSQILGIFVKGDYALEKGHLGDRTPLLYPPGLSVLVISHSAMRSDTNTLYYRPNHYWNFTFLPKGTDMHLRSAPLSMTMRCMRSQVRVLDVSNYFFVRFWDVFMRIN